MDWTPIITAGVTGLCAVLGQWVISNRKTKEDEARDAEREKNQNQRLDSLESKMSDLIHTTEKLSKEIDENCMRILRLDLLHAIETDPNNQIVILDLAYKYFVDMKGNCYMSKMFQEWADEHHVNITSIFNKG